MKIKLIDEWRDVIKKAWSVRLIIAAALMSGIEVALPLFSDSFPRGIFSILSFFSTAGAVLARVYSQKAFRGDE